MLEEGILAPDFTARDQSGKIQKLKDYRGKWVILYFYPKDFTSGCTKEACAFRDEYEKLSELAIVFGVSGDSVSSHRGFSDKYKIPFPLLSDPKRSIIKEYEANGLSTKRITYIIGPDGKIIKVYPKVIPQAHAVQVLTDLKNFSL